MKITTVFFNGFRQNEAGGKEILLFYDRLQSHTRVESWKKDKKRNEKWKECFKSFAKTDKRREEKVSIIEIVKAWTIVESFVVVMFGKFDFMFMERFIVKKF